MATQQRIYMNQILNGAGAVLGLWLLVFCAQGRAQTQTEVAAYDKLIVIPDAKATSTSFWMIVKAGCRDEPGGECHGMAHYVEHLVFLGRNADHKKVAVGFFADAQANGYTTHTTTVYSQKFPLREGGQLGDLEKLFRFHAERLETLDFSEEDAVRERGIVRQEYALRYGRNPSTAFYYQLERDLHPSHPQGQAGIGTPEDIEGYTTDRARAFHRIWYSRDNAAFVIHGPVDPAAVKSLYDKYIGVLPHRAVPERDWLNARFDFSPMAKVRDMTDKDAGQKSWWLAKSVLYPEENRRRLSEAQWLVSAYLNSSLDGSPKDILVDQRGLLKSVGVSLNRLAAGAMEASVQAVPEDSTDDAATQTAFADYFINLAKAGLSGATLERLKKRVDDQFVQRDKQPREAADSIVSWLAAHNSFEDYQKRRAVMASVTLEDVNLILAALATPGRSVSGSLAPAR